MATRFTPIAGSLDVSLLGTGDPVKFTASERGIDTTTYTRGFVRLRNRSEYQDGGYQRNEGDGTDEKSKKEINENIINVIILIIVSAIIFITIVSIYQVIKVWLSNQEAIRTLTNPRSGNTEQDIENTIIANEGVLMSDIKFAVFCFLTTILFLFLFFHYSLRRSPGRNPSGY